LELLIGEMDLQEAKAITARAMIIVNFFIVRLI
jgi:hypothetical protein